MSVNLNLSPMIDSARYVADQGALKAPDPDSELREAAEQFEAIFLNEFLKQARKQNLLKTFLPVPKETYEGMLTERCPCNCLHKLTLVLPIFVRQLGGKESEVNVEFV